MADQNRPVDLITLSDALKNNAALKNAGGHVFMATTAGKLVSTRHLEEHALMLFNAHLCRRLYLMANRLAEQARSGKLSGEELLIRAHQQLDELALVTPLFASMKDAATIIAEAKEAGMERMALYQHGQTCSGVPTGLPGLDNLLCGWQKGELAILAARPSIGKTALALRFAMEAIKANKHTVIYSLEMIATRSPLFYPLKFY